MTATCNNCGASKLDDGYRACEACRAGGTAEQKDALIALVAAAKDTTRILEAVRFTAGLGKGQIARVKKLQAAIAQAEKVLAK